MEHNIKNLAKYQQEVQILHDKYCTEISESMISWAFKQADKLGFRPAMYNKRKPDALWCPLCGEVFGRGADKCPHCGAKLGSQKMSDGEVGCMTFKDWFCFNEVTTCHGWQIVRFWIADFKFTKGRRAEMCYIGSMFERWFNPAIGKEVLLGKYRGCFPYYRRIPWAISYFGSTEGYVHRNLQLTSYDDFSDFVYPKVRILDSYKVKGAQRIPAGGDFSKAFRMLTAKENSEITETILKVGRKAEIALMTRNFVTFRKWWRTILVSRRHGFKYEKYGDEYFDYLRQLEELHLDTRSPHYVAPADFKAMHQEMTRRLNVAAERRRREWQREREIREYERAKNAEEEFIKARKKYFGLLLVSENYTAQPLKSVKEFLDEGLAMEHCVFSCSYFNPKVHPNSLILSVRGNDGERMVTIEISTKDWKIKQCYAKHDNIHPQDEQIRAFINANMETIKSFSKPQKRASA